MSKQSNQSIKTVTNYFLMKPMLFSNLKLHFTTTRSSIFSGFKLVLLRVTTLRAKEKTRSDLDEAAGTVKTTLTSLARGGTVYRDASPIPAGPWRTAHQATVGNTSFFTPWSTLNFFSSSSSFTMSANSFLWYACRWFLNNMHHTRTRTRNPNFLVKPDSNPTRSQKALLVMAWLAIT